MSLDPAELESAVRRGDAPAVRELLRHAPEAERTACAKALRSFLQGPEFFMAAPVMLGPDQFMQFLRSGWQDKPDGIIEQEREQEERNRGYNAWRAIADGLAFQLAAFGLAGGVAAAARLAQEFPLRYWGTGAARSIDSPAHDTELVAQVLADRRPAWLADFMDRHLRQSPGGIDAWPLARMLVRLGAIQRPAIAEYTTLMPSGLRREDPDYTGYRESSPGPADLLLADPGLLEDEVWRLFTVPEAGTALEKEDRWIAMPDDNGVASTATWSRALAQLAAEGHLDRDRLLDACLGAFTRDFNPNRVTWYATLLEQLAPSQAEIVARQATFRGLLAARSKAGVTIGQQALRRLADAGLADVGPLLDASGPALLFRQKSVATAQLKLIQKAAALHPAHAGDAAAAVAVAFGHERQDIQEAALALIGKLGVPAGQPLAEIRRLAADLSPSLIPQAIALGLLDAPVDDAATDDAATDEPLPGQAAIEARIGTLPAAAAEDLSWALTVARAGEVPGPARVEPQAGAVLPAPVTDPDELIQLLAMLIEDARDALAAERALAGAVRLSELPRQQRARVAAPVLRRAQRIMREYDPFSGDLITSDMALVTHVWAGEELPDAEDSREIGSYKSETYAVSGTGRALTMAGIFSARAWEAARLIEAGRGGVLLAEPETERGAITAETLLERVRELGRRRRPVGPYDRDVALLRLAPGPAGNLWDELGRLLGRPADALEETHRLVQLPVQFEPVCGLPLGRPLRHSHRWHPHVLAKTVGTVPAAPGCASWQLMTALSDPLADHGVLYGPSRFELRQYDAAVAAWTLICPWQPEVAAAHLLRPLSDGLIPGLTPATTAIQSIQHPGHPLGPVGHLALVTGLSSDAGDTRIAAAQLWSQACSDGRLNARLAAEAVVSGVKGNALKVSRIADSLQHASHTALGAHRVVQTVCIAAEAFSPHFPAGMHALFELAAGLGSKVGVAELPETVREVAARSGSTRLVTTARQLMQSADGQAPERGAAVEQAIAAVLARAEPQNPEQAANP